MKLRLKDVRDLVEETDAISILLKSSGDVYENYVDMKGVPKEFDDCEIVEIGFTDSIAVDEYDFLLEGIEIYLDDSEVDIDKISKLK